MFKKHILAAAIGIILLGGTTLKADLFLTVNSFNPAISPYTIQETNPAIIAVDGNTPFEPNDITVTAENGTLSNIPDTNYQYYIEFNTDSAIASISLTVNTDISIDTRSIAAGTIIYNLYLLYNSDDNTRVAIGIGLEELIALEEVNKEQSQPLIPESIMASNSELPVDEVAASDLSIQTDYNLPIRQVSSWEKYKVTAYCPNSIDERMIWPFLQQEANSTSLPQAANMPLGDESELTENVIVIDSNITTNQIWTADNIYYITGGISVQALLVIEPGTIIEFAWRTYMTVENGGTLISSGTPDEPIIYTVDFLYPDWGHYYIYIHYGYYYYFPIYIKETASPSTTVTYCFIEGAVVGIATENIKLDHPIENNYLIGNWFGIGEYGTRHTDIINNLCVYNYVKGIEVYLGDVNGVGDGNSVITIKNNTCDAYQDYGITVHGVENEQDAGLAIISNNIVSESWVAGLNLVDGWLSFIVTNTGYYYNERNKNWEFEEYNPVYSNGWPYVDGESIMDFCYLYQDYTFINASDEYIEQTRLIGKTTDISGTPDSGLLDLGFHHPNWQFSNAGDGNTLSSDLNRDGIVNFIDFASLAVVWPLDKDIYDLDVMADDWLKTASIDPNIQIQINGDQNNGYVDVGVSGYSFDTMQVFLLANGEYIGRMPRFKDGEPLTIDISEFGQGVQQFKLVSANDSGHITCSNIADIEFSRPLNYCILPETYIKNQSLPFAAYNPSGGNASVKVYANGGNVVWSQNFNGNSILGSIPAEVLTDQNDIDFVSFDDSYGQSCAKKVTAPKEPNKFDVRALIIIPDYGMNIRDYQVIDEVRKAFKNRGIIYEEWFGQLATYENIGWYGWHGANIKYIYLAAHGSYAFETTPGNYVARTYVKLYDYDVVSMRRSDFANPNNVPPWCEDLGYWEGQTKSFLSMGFTTLEFVYFNTCYGARLNINAYNQLVPGRPGQEGIADHISDMSIALGMHEPSRTRYYQSWYDESWVSFPLFPKTDYQKWNRNEWQLLGEGEDLYWAIYYTILEQTHFGPLDPANNYRLKGQGSWMDIILQSW